MLSLYLNKNQRGHHHQRHNPEEARVEQHGGTLLQYFSQRGLGTLFWGTLSFRQGLQNLGYARPLLLRNRQVLEVGCVHLNAY